VAKVRFEPARVDLVAPAGERLVDLCDDHPETRVPFSCRSGNCATCRVEVLEGDPGLSSPDDEEQATLDIFGPQPRVRLCCQLRITDARAQIVLRVIDPL